MNVNNRLGWYNTALLRQYSFGYPPFAWVVRMIKAWARHFDLNKSSSTKHISFSSYALTLMTIALLQASMLSLR